MALRAIREGDEAPEVGGADLTHRRRAAIQEILRLMACTHGRGTECEHTGAVQEFAGCMIATDYVVGIEAIKTLPRPLTMTAIEEILGQIAPVLLLSGDETPRGL